MLHVSVGNCCLEFPTSKMQAQSAKHLDKLECFRSSSFKDRQALTFP